MSNYSLNTENSVNNISLNPPHSLNLSTNCSGDLNISHALTRKVSYDISRKLCFNNFSSNLIKYILEYFPINEYIEIKKVCKNLNRIIQSMNLFKEYMSLIKQIKTYPKNIPEALFKENAAFLVSRLKFESFLKEDEKIKIIQNYLHFYLRGKKMIYLPDSLRIGENGIYFLTLYLTFQGCEVQLLNLNYNSITEDSAVYFSQAMRANQSLKYLHLNGINFSTEACGVIGEGIEKNKSLEKLEMCYNSGNLRTEGITAIFAKIKFSSSIQSLFFSDNLIRKDGGKILGEFLKENQLIRELFIEKNELGDEGVSFIAESLRFNKSLLTLNISDNQISSMGLKVLVGVLNQDYLSERSCNKTLSKLYMRSNIFHNSEASRLLGELVSHNKTLTYLDLSNNNLSEHLIRPISEGLKINKTLQSLILESNAIGGLGCYILCDGLKYNRGLKFINLRNNSLGFEGAKHIADMLQTNRSLSNMNLQANLLDEHSITLIADKIGYNTELKIINLAYNQLTNIRDLINNLTLAKDVIMY